MRYMVPLTAKLVVCDDDHGVFSADASLDFLEQVINKVLASRRDVRVAGMFVLQTDRFHEADRIELAGARRRLRQLEKLRLVSQVSSSRCAGCKAGVVVEGLVVVLKDFVRAVGKSGVHGGIWVRAVWPSAVRPAGCTDIAIRI